MKISLLPAVLLSICSLAPAAVLDFETLPNGLPPADRLVISNQFWMSHGASFRYENGAAIEIAGFGPPRSAFWGPPNSSTSDLLATNQNCGRFCLTDGAGVNAPPPPLVIELREAVSTISGEIIDSEDDSWRIEARNQQTQIVATIIITNTSPNIGDGKATPWSFERPSADIQSVRIVYTDNNGSAGWALDNLAIGLPFLPPKLSIRRAPQGNEFSLAGTFGRSYQIEQADSLPSTNWQTLTTLLLTNAPKGYYTDPSPTDQPGRFFRAVGIP